MLCSASGEALTLAFLVKWMEEFDDSVGDTLAILRQYFGNTSALETQTFS
jgi:hypothetical protein